ncbi:MAG: Xaa-Pro peptidase family protein [Deltaproteobacteria bacterium]|nr:Xaa-Pro peptidase family protein [Deltaproteobacteria bacterium]
MEPPERKNEILHRIERLQGLLREQDIDGALLTERIDRVYFTATDQDAHLYVPAGGRPLLMVRKSMDRAVQDAAIDDVVPLRSFSEILRLIQRHSGYLPRRMGLELDVLPMRFYRTYEKHFPDVELLDIWPLIRQVRMIKSSYEVDCLKRGAHMADEMYARVPQFLDTAETENDLAAQVEYFYRSHGHPGLVPARGFNQIPLYGHIMAGANAALPSNSSGATGGKGLGPFLSQGAGKGKLRRNDPILIDYVGNVGGYNADQTRIFVMGKLDPELLTAHEVMREIQDTIAHHGRPGTVTGDLYERALSIAQRAGLHQTFMGFPDPVPFVGHGVGLELNEWPVIGRGLKTTLEEGMALAIEPKVVFPGKGVVGIENTFVVTSSGMERLNRFPDDIVNC